MSKDEHQRGVFPAFEDAASSLFRFSLKRGIIEAQWWLLTIL